MAVVGSALEGGSPLRERLADLAAVPGTLTELLRIACAARPSPLGRTGLNANDVASVLGALAPLARQVMGPSAPASLAALLRAMADRVDAAATGASAAEPGGPRFVQW